jgi:tripartite-type tricarboxylate transporter receptor subunit TctC
MKTFIPAVLFASIAACAAAQTAAQTFPTRPLRIVVPLPPGGSNDLVARVFSEKMPPLLGQPVLVENRPGGSGIPATDFVAKSPADGYTMLLSNTGHIFNVGFFSKLPYDSVKDFTPITIAYHVHFALACNAAVPVGSLKEFIAYGRSNPGKLTYASAGVGQPHHMGMELLQAMTGAKYLHVPYKGAGQFVPAMLSNEVNCVIGAINSLLPHVKSGKLRAFAMAGESETSQLPGVPPIASELPGYLLDNWTSVIAPAGTPQPVVRRLNKEFATALKSPDTIERLTPQGIEVIASSPEEYTQRYNAGLAKWTKIIRDANIRID